jgi:hypothetical protein
VPCGPCGPSTPAGPLAPAIPTEIAEFAVGGFTDKLPLPPADTVTAAELLAALTVIPPLPVPEFTEILLFPLLSFTVMLLMR